MQLTETAAIHTAMTGTTFERTKMGLIALRELLNDNENTEMVFILGIALNRGRIGKLLTQLVTSDSGSWLLDNKPAINSTTVDFDRLRSLPAQTLGREYVRFLDDNGLDADFFEAPPGLAPAIRFIAQRMRQSHDIWHTVTGYGSDPGGEIQLQAFTYAQLGAPSAGLIAVAGSLRGMREQLDLPLCTLRAFRRGLRAEKFAPIIWEDHWERPLAELRAELGLH